jgi:hypothetical protein
MASLFTTSKPYNIRIETKFGVFTLAANSSEEMNDWIRELNGSIKSMKGKPHLEALPMASPDIERIPKKGSLPIIPTLSPIKMDYEDGYDTEDSLELNTRKRGKDKLRKQKIDPTDLKIFNGTARSTDTSMDLSLSTNTTLFDKKLLICCPSLSHIGEDFIEIVIKIETFAELLNVVAKELDVRRDSILKIRKPVNRILVRKDEEVERLLEGEKLEVILKLDEKSVV